MHTRRTYRQSSRVLAVGLLLAFGSAQAQYAAELELSGLNGSNGLVLNGVATEDEAGTSVGYAGDVNGDGVDDLIIGAPYATTGAQYSGATYVVFGTNQAIGNPLELSTIDGGNGFVSNGVAQFDFAGYSVSRAGDVNHDGIDDIAIGAPVASPSDAEAGISYVVYGSDQGLPSPLSLGDLDGSNGFAINGVGIYSNSGTSVSAAGDVNGDGIDDLVIGAPYAGSGAGAVFVVFGKNGNLPHPLSLAGLNGSDGFRINGAAAGDSLGTSVSSVDINGDGVDDLILGAPLAGPSGNNPGITYVIYGNDQGFSNPVNLSALSASDGMVINGVTVGDEAGNSVSGAGDVNGDGVDDLVIGAPGADPNGSASGAAYVVFGNNVSLPGTLNLSALDGNNGFAMAGVGPGDKSGTAVSKAGDINRDGIDDLIVGAPGPDPDLEVPGPSYVYVVFGSDQAWSASIELSGLNGSNGFKINGAATGDELGASVGAAGDFNADGHDDFVMGAPQADPGGDKSGAAYVVYDPSTLGSNIIFMNGFEP